MKKWVIIFSILPALFLLGACKKSQLKKPTEVNFAFDLNKSFGPNTPLKFQSGEITIANFNVAGSREEGEGVDFKRNFPGNLSTDMNNSGEVSNLDYDLPQGVYTEILLDFKTPVGSTEPTLQLEGNYKKTAGPNVPIQFEFTGEQQFMIYGEDFEGADRVTLDASTAEKVTIEMDPIHWFETVPLNMLDNADMVEIGNKMTILINSTTNTEIYNMVVERIDESNQAFFK